MPVLNIIPGQKINPEKLERARALRRELTSAEKMLWQELRGDKLGVHFRRQQIIAGFIVDFYCHSASLVIEIDGGIHDETSQKENDMEREKILNEMGLRIVRFRNDEVEKELVQVLVKIRELI